jgi:tetratricopeptide (TPR) repeat protein
MPLKPTNNANAGIAAENRGRYDEAIDLFTQGISEPDASDNIKASYYNLRCVAYLHKAQFDSAISDCNDAIRLKPSFAEAYNNRAAAYNNKGQHDLAIADLDVAIGIEPNNATAYENRGSAYSLKGQYDRAIADLNKALRLKPDFAVAYIVRSKAYLLKEDIDHAISDATEAIHLNKKNTAAYDVRSVAYTAKRDFQNALADVNSAIHLQPNMAGLHFDRGILELAMEKYADAATDLAQTQKLQPTNTEAILWLHLARTKSGENDASELEQSVKATDQTRWPSLILALYRHKVTAERLLDIPVQGDSLVARSFRCQISFHVGEYDLLDQDTTAAKRLLQRAAEICPSYAAEKIMAGTELNKLGR